MSRQYITTAIDYPNALPHMGHVMEKVLADTVARWFRLRGDEVRFQIGTDEHGVKIERKAKDEGIAPQALVDRNVPLYSDLYQRLQISFDVFVRTTDRQKHWPTVQALWKKLIAAKVLKKRTYTGLYCAGCERFMTKRDLVDGRCTIHNSAPEEVSEENYFFLMSEETAWLKDLLTREGGYGIIPASRAAETFSLIGQGLEDVSFSRPQSSLQWGIPVPDDPEHVMYVWCDALTNYLSGLGFFTDREEREWWDKPAEVTHVIGKDIARFHALIWPAMLKHADVRMPDRLLIHGFLTSEGQKMSKTIGNVVSPEEVLQKFSGNPDPLRFYLSGIPVGNDGDFSWERIIAVYDGVLRNGLGNLLNRVLVLLKKEGGDLLSPVDPENGGQFWGPWEHYGKFMDAFDLAEALDYVTQQVKASNFAFNDQRVWEQNSDRKKKDLSEFAERLRHIALMLLPFIPKTAQEISRQLNVPYAPKMLEKDFVITPAMKQWGGLRQGYGRQGGQKDWKNVGEPRILFAPLSQ